MKNVEFDKLNMGKRIRCARENKGLTREQLAEGIGLSVNSVANIELGHNGTQLDNFVKLCKLLDISADYLLFGETTERPAIQRITELLAHQDEKHLAAIEKVICSLIETPDI